MSNLLDLTEKLYEKKLEDRKKQWAAATILGTGPKYGQMPFRPGCTGPLIMTHPVKLNTSFQDFLGSKVKGRKKGKTTRKEENIHSKLHNKSDAQIDFQIKEEERREARKAYRATLTLVS